MPPTRNVGILMQNKNFKKKKGKEKKQGKHREQKVFMVSRGNGKTSKDLIVMVERDSMLHQTRNLISSGVK